MDRVFKRIRDDAAPLGDRGEFLHFGAVGVCAEIVIRMAAKRAGASARVPRHIDGQAGYLGRVSPDSRQKVAHEAPTQPHQEHFAPHGTPVRTAFGLGAVAENFLVTGRARRCEGRDLLDADADRRLRDSPARPADACTAGRPGPAIPQGGTGLLASCGPGD